MYYCQILRRISSSSLISKILIESESCKYTLFYNEDENETTGKFTDWRGRRGRNQFRVIYRRGLGSTSLPASLKNAPKRRRTVKRAQGRRRVRTRMLPPVFVRVAELIPQSLPRSRLAGLLSETRGPPLAQRREHFLTNLGRWMLEWRKRRNGAK